MSGAKEQSLWSPAFPLEEKIREAFDCSVPVESISANDAHNLNHGINRLDKASIMRILPLLLLRELQNNHEFSFQGSGDHLVYFLDGALLRDKAEAERSGNYGPYAAQHEVQTRRFSEFSSRKAEAILAWLRDVAIPKYGDLCPEDIASAIQFWDEKLRAGE